jgi:hypothetical protein
MQQEVSTPWNDGQRSFAAGFGLPKKALSSRTSIDTRE